MVPLGISKDSEEGTNEITTTTVKGRRTIPQGNVDLAIPLSVEGQRYLEKEGTTSSNQRIPLDLPKT